VHWNVIINKEFMFSYIRFSFCDMTVMSTHFDSGIGFFLALLACG
jgi:hypothetical protein